MVVNKYYYHYLYIIIIIIIIIIIYFKSLIFSFKYSLYFRGGVRKCRKVCQLHVFLNPATISEQCAVSR